MYLAFVALVGLSLVGVTQAPRRHQAGDTIVAIPNDGDWPANEQATRRLTTRL